ncbi:replication initiation negative regulator SeqA [Aestuariibacter sp. A3R04]|uniref:replication initiation negative regulator SeqA n=1 Tax=Aestuariibacter sp. A3R04 TaxID=2841571 RepID=UPI001C09C7DA|nr:replication initiation negative regulator SeqA [Aestuariibacter sp. A3R04]MBU3022598.1 replication initiation negative regulator SeqA [Aestuariibacter sp. A3R04]
MKIIEIDDELYTFIASQTKHIGESASEILRRLLMTDADHTKTASVESSIAKESVSVASVDKTSQSAKSQTQSKKAVAPKRQSSARTPAAEFTFVNGSGDIENRLNDKALANYSKRVDQFLFILSELHDLHKTAFSKVEEIKGKNRIYFATSKEALLNTGSSTNPKQIPNSDYWVVTNNNTAKKVAMLRQVLQTLGYTEDAIGAIIAKFA